jgi:hypothetical protein
MRRLRRLRIRILQKNVMLEMGFIFDFLILNFLKVLKEYIYYFLIYFIYKEQV